MEDWVDSKGYSCLTYTDCENVDTWAVKGVSAGDACCVCGGGSKIIPKRKKLSKTSKNKCADLYGWVDSQNFTCADYGACENVHQWGVDGISAMDACCLCGGGTNGKMLSAEKY